MYFNTNYKEPLELIDHCIPNLKAISSLMYFYGMGEDWGKEDKSNVYGLLDSLLCDIANGLEKYAEKKIKE